MDEAVATWTATRQAAALRAGEITSRDLLELYLDRIERLNPPVNSVIRLAVDAARADADRADDEANRGEWRGPLHGLPITIKDAIEVRGITSTGGARELTEHVPPQDAPSVARLRDAGAVIFGKTNVPRWSGDIQTYNDVFGVTSNPWDLARIPGGSSGGAAAAVAAGFTSFEIGTDIGGSVRVPSHCCGVYGLKPSYGVISQRGYLDHVGGGTTDADINVFGPIARGADDLELLLGVLAGPDADRALGWSLELPAPRQTDLSDFRVGLWLEDPLMPIDRDELAILRKTADALSDAGARVEDTHPDVEFKEQVDLFHELIVPAISPSFDEDSAENLSRSHLRWLRNDKHRARLRSLWASWFEDYDALLCPVLPVPAFPHNNAVDMWDRTITVNEGEEPYMIVTNWAGLIGVVGLPSAVPPVGVTPGGLPVGIQVVAPYLRDREAVKLAGLVADVTGTGYRVPPGF